MSQQLLRRDEIVLFVNQRAVLFAQSMQRFASVYAMRLYPDENAIEDRLAAIMLIERGIPPLVSEIQAATTNAGTRAQGGLTPDLLTLSLGRTRGKSVLPRRSTARSLIYADSKLALSNQWKNTGAAR